MFIVSIIVKSMIFSWIFPVRERMWVRGFFQALENAMCFSRKQQRRSLFVHINAEWVNKEIFSCMHVGAYSGVKFLPRVPLNYLKLAKFFMSIFLCYMEKLFFFLLASFHANFPLANELHFRFPFFYFFN